MRDYNPQIMSATTLVGDEVYNSKDEHIGEIKEFMLDLDSGQVAYAVLSFGGFLGMGDKLFAIPWEALTVDTENKRVLLDVDKEKLKNAPGFDKDNWPSSPDRTFIDQVHQHYGYDPYYRRSNTGAALTM